MTTLATCWKITREDATILGFTDHDIDLTVDGVVYLAAVGYKPSAVEHKSDGSVDNMEVTGAIHFSGIDDDDLRSGLYDYARVECFQVDWSTSTADVALATGWIGQVSIIDRAFNAELRGLTQKLHKEIGEQYTPQCSAIFGDTECGYTLTPIAFTITAASSNRIFTDSSLTQAADYFKHGIITVSTGNNAGFEMDVKEFSTGVVELYEPMPNQFQVGDTGFISRGCNRTLDTCRDSFNNVINFRGFPHLPGLSEILR